MTGRRPSRLKLHIIDAVKCLVSLLFLLGSKQLLT